MRIKNVHLVIFGIAFTLVQFWFGIGGMGMEGRGSGIVMEPFSFFGLNWLLLMFALFWTTKAKGATGWLVFLAVMTVHYAVTASGVFAEVHAYQLAPNEDLGLGRVLARYPQELVYGAVTYLIGNLLIWGLFFKRNSILKQT